MGTRVEVAQPPALVGGVLLELSHDSVLSGMTWRA